MKTIFYHVRWFYNYTFYVGVLLRKRLFKKGLEDLKRSEVSSQFWLGLLNTLIVGAYIVPFLLSEEDVVTLSKQEFNLYFVIPWLIKAGFDYYVFYRNDYWIDMVNTFEHNFDRRTKRIYLVIFVAFFLLTIALYIRWFFVEW